MYNVIGKNRPKVMPIFLACSVHTGGSWFLLHLLFVGRWYFLFLVLQTVVCYCTEMVPYTHNNSFRLACEQKGNDYTGYLWAYLKTWEIDKTMNTKRMLACAVPPLSCLHFTCVCMLAAMPMRSSNNNKKLRISPGQRRRNTIASQSRGR